MADRQDPDKWHLDKGIPVGLIFALLAQFAWVVYENAQIDARVEVLEQRAFEAREEIEEQRLISGDVSERLAAIEAVLKRIEQNQRELADDVDGMTIP